MGEKCTILFRATCAIGDPGELALRSKARPEGGRHFKSQLVKTTGRYGRSPLAPTSILYQAHSCDSVLCSEVSSFERRSDLSELVREAREVLTG
jgi:hypothetical protein